MLLELSLFLQQKQTIKLTEIIIHNDKMTIS